MNTCDPSSEMPATSPPAPLFPPLGPTEWIVVAPLERSYTSVPYRCRTRQRLVGVEEHLGAVARAGGVGRTLGPVPPPGPTDRSVVTPPSRW